MANLAARSAAVFSLSAKNRTGGAEINPPPPVRGLIFRHMEGVVLPEPSWWHDAAPSPPSSDLLCYVVPKLHFHTQSVVSPEFCHIFHIAVNASTIHTMKNGENNLHWGVTVHVSTCIPRFYILGTAELIVLKFVTGVEFDRICGFDKAMGA